MNTDWRTRELRGPVTGGGGRGLTLALWIALAVTLTAAAVTAAEAPDYLSPTSLAASPDGKTLYAACETAGCVLVFDTGTEKVTARYPVARVNRLVLSPDGARLYAAAGGADGVIHELDAPTGRILRSFPAGHTPESPVLSADGKTLFFCDRFSRADQKDIHALDLATGKIKASAKAIREPSTLCLSKDGKTLWVGNYLPHMPANSQHVYATLSLYDSVTLAEVATLDLPSGAFCVRDSALSADGRYYFVTHSIGRFSVPTTHLDRGWINTSAVSVFETATRRYVNSVLLDDTVKGAANPWGLAVSGDGRWLCVNVSGTHELIVIDLKEMMKRISGAPNPKEVVNDLGFLYGAKTRVQLEGLGPRALAVCGDKAYSAMFFSDSLNIVELWDDGPGAAVELPLADSKAAPNLIRSGELAFHDATFCYQQWLSCASCHPEGRSDGTNWDLMNDGIGNPKNSRSLLYAHKTSPVMITGVRASAEIAVTKGFALIQFHELPEDRLDSVNAYLKAQEPLRSPYRNPDGSLTAAALRGKVVFEGKAGCVACHVPPYHGDKKKYVLGLGSDGERDRAFATPILIEVWRSAPYMYDGRAASIREVIATDNVNNQHGNTKDLTPREVDDLAEYVNSL
jgi:sugar lactone lactonase YvrE